MNIRLSAPSKTFLSGEYAVLLGAPAIVLNTQPRFTFTASRGGQGVDGIPEGSPAARWLEQRRPVWQDWGLQFSDPHAGRGGFGASGAQFLMAHTFTTFLQISVSRATEGLDMSALWNDFQVLRSGQGSGVDILAQATGQVALIERTKQSYLARAWPYPELGFAILRTGSKVLTHTHLQTLKAESLQPLVAPTAACFASFGLDSAEKFLIQVIDFAAQLRELNLQSETTRQWLQLLEAEPWCKAAKGCGALGADTVLAFFASADSPAAIAFFAQQGWEVVGSPETLSPGIELQWSWS